MADPFDPDPRRTRLDQLDVRAERGGGEARIARQHAAGKRTARERLALLLDEGSFVELDKLKTHRCADAGMAEHRVPGDGVVTGHGRVAGRPVVVVAQDFTVFGGSVSGAHAEKVCKALDLAARAACPVVTLHDSGGARIQEGIVALAGYAEILARHARLSGAVPQVAVVLGPCAGSAVYGPATCDFVVVADGAALFLSGPDAVREATGEEVTLEELGGAAVHAEGTGVAHFAPGSEDAALALVRELLGFLPTSHLAEPPRAAAEPPPGPEDALARVLPEGVAAPYDAREVLRAVVDGGRLLEAHARHAPRLVTALARVDGRPVGIVASQPAADGGALDAAAAAKGARFVRTCDAFGLPILTFVDVPGFAAGTAQEWGGVVPNGAKLLYAFAEATVPKLTVVTRRAWGGAYVVMASKHLGADLSLAWPSAEIAVMDPEGAVGILHRKELAGAEGDAARHALRERLVAEYRARFANPTQAAELGYVDEVIRPEQTRARLARALELLGGRRRDPIARRHGNIPL